MQPSIDLRLSAMMKALSEVVMPALDPSDRMAQEQASVILGSMDLLREQINYAHWYEVVELRSLCALAGALEAVTGLPSPGLTSAREQGQRLLPRTDITLATLRDASYQLRDAISSCVEVAWTQGSDTRHAVQRLVLDHSKEQLDRERAYIARTKWDGYPETLQPIEAVLCAAG